MPSSDANSGASRPRITRRQLAVGVGAIGAAAATAAPAALSREEAPADSLDVPWLAGLVDRVAGPTAVYIRVADEAGVAGNEVRVELAEGAVVIRDGPSDLTAFASGEAISAIGGFEGESFRATRVEAIYHIAQEKVAAAGEDELQTRDGTSIRLGSETEAEGGTALGHELAATPPEELRPGDQVVVLGRRTPGRDEIAANRVGLIVD
jgi:hypothetical protein